MLVDESVDGAAGGVMLLDTESPEPDPRGSVDPTAIPDEHGSPGRHRPSPWRIPVGELLPAWQ